MPARRTRRKVPRKKAEPKPEVTLVLEAEEPPAPDSVADDLISKITPENLPDAHEGGEAAPESKQTGTYGFQAIARFESADGREIRKLEALEKERDPMVILKSSTRFLDENGNVVACSEALTTLRGTISSLKGGRW